MAFEDTIAAISTPIGEGALIWMSLEAVAELRSRSEEHEAAIKEARGALDAIRSIVSELDIARATAEADLSHLAHTCEDAVNATLDDYKVPTISDARMDMPSSQWPSESCMMVSMNTVGDSLGRHVQGAGQPRFGLMAVWVTLSSAAASVKLMCRAATSKARNPWSEGSAMTRRLA